MSKVSTKVSGSGSIVTKLNFFSQDQTKIDFTKAHLAWIGHFFSHHSRSKQMFNATCILNHCETCPSFHDIFCANKVFQLKKKPWKVWSFQMEMASIEPKWIFCKIFNKAHYFQQSSFQLLKSPTLHMIHKEKNWHANPSWIIVNKNQSFQSVFFWQIKHFMRKHNEFNAQMT